MLNLAYQLSSSWEYFSKECARLKDLFSKLQYPAHLVDNTISKFLTSVKTTTERTSHTISHDESVFTRIVLPFKDQKSADIVRRQLRDLSIKIGKTLQPVFISRKIENDVKIQEKKPPLINQQSVVYRFKCGLRDASYVGFTRRHFYQRVAEHQSSTIGNHLKTEHNLEPRNLEDRFTILRKCKTKLDCLIYEMLYIRDLKPNLNTQSDSIRAKLFCN